MKKIKSLVEYCELLQEKINQSLDEEVFDVVKNTMLKAIEKEVYSSYTPIADGYQRRGGNGGLIDESNIIKERDGGILSVMNITPPSPPLYGTFDSGNQTALSQWIEYGQVPNIFNNNDYVWMHPRPFIKTTAEMLEQKQSIKKALKKGLKKRRVKVK